jgi:hypothetical protein
LTAVMQAAEQQQLEKVGSDDELFMLMLMILLMYMNRPWVLGGYLVTCGLKKKS